MHPIRISGLGTRVSLSIQRENPTEIMQYQAAGGMFINCELVFDVKPNPAMILGSQNVRPVVPDPSKSKTRPKRYNKGERHSFLIAFQSKSGSVERAEPGGSRAAMKAPSSGVRNCRREGGESGKSGRYMKSSPQITIPDRPIRRKHHCHPARPPRPEAAADLHKLSQS